MRTLHPHTGPGRARRSPRNALRRLAIGLMVAGIPAPGAPLAQESGLAARWAGRPDPLGVVRTSIRPRVWILLDTSESMSHLLGESSDRRFDAARDVIRWIADSLESELGEPLAHWRLADFKSFAHAEGGSSEAEVCDDPTMGAGLPRGSPVGPPVTPVRCSEVRIRSDPSGCDAAAARDALLRNLPTALNTNRTPNGIALYQLATHIASEATDDLAPGQKNVIVLLTDGIDSCECLHHAWKDFNDGPAGFGGTTLWLRTADRNPEPVLYEDPSRQSFGAWNAGLKAKAAYLALNGGDPDAQRGDIYVVGMAMTGERSRGYSNHLAWMASHGRHPAIFADQREDLEEALFEVLSDVTLPPGKVKLSAPRLATVKELVASAPDSSFAGSDPALPADALVAPADAGAAQDEVLRLRAAYRDNILISTAAELDALRGHLSAIPTLSGDEGNLAETSVWDAGTRLAERDPEDRLMLFNRPGSRELRPFRVGEVTAQDLGVGVGYLSALDGTGARRAEDAAEIVVRLIRGEELSVSEDTGTIYGPDGELHFGGGRGTWKLREGLASPAVVTNPLRHPDRVATNREPYRVFFSRHVNRRTMIYLPTHGGVVHAFAGDTGEEVFAYVPDDVLGPAPFETDADRTFLRDLALAGVRGASWLQRDLAHRFTLAGSPTVRDVFLPGAHEWRTVLSFGRSVGGRFVTGLDVSDVGDGWRGDHDPPRPAWGGVGLPGLLFNIGNRETGPGNVEQLGETPEPLMVEVPSGAGSEWVAFLPAGYGNPEDDSGEWLLALSIEDGEVHGRYPVEPAPSPEIPKNGAVTAAAPWRPAWALAGASELVTHVYVADLHGQIHRLLLSNPGLPDWGVAHRLGADHPILTPPVVFPFPGRTEPHLLVVAGGDRRVADTPSVIVLLRDEGTRMREVWRKTLADGEAPQGKPAVLTDGSAVEVVLATRTDDRTELSCDVVTAADGVARLRSFDGLTGAELEGIVDDTAEVVSFGPGRIRGISLSSAGNLALSVSGIGGKVVDTVIGDFKFRVRDGALEDVTLFVEGFRGSPFWSR